MGHVGVTPQYRGGNPGWGIAEGRDSHERASSRKYFDGRERAGKPGEARDDA